MVSNVFIVLVVALVLVLVLDRQILEHEDDDEFEDDYRINMQSP
jgi:hypothetical protein